MDMEGEESEVQDIVAQVIAKDKEVMKSFHEGLLQCASWVMIKQYLSQGRIVSKVNWLNAIHTLLTKLQGVTLSNETEILNTLVSVMVRVKKCECSVSSVLALEDLIIHLTKLRRFPELEDDISRIQEVIIEAQCQVVVQYQCELGDSFQATAAWDLYFHHVCFHQSSDDALITYKAIADGLKKVICPDSKDLSSVEDFVEKHSLQNFCESAWALVEYLISTRLQEPRLFKEVRGRDLLKMMSEEKSLSLFESSETAAPTPQKSNVLSTEPSKHPPCSEDKGFIGKKRRTLTNKSSEAAKSVESSPTKPSKRLKPSNLPEPSDLPEPLYSPDPSYSPEPSDSPEPCVSPTTAEPSKLSEPSKSTGDNSKDQEMDGVLKPCIDGHSDSNPRVVRQDNDEDIQTISDASDDIVQTPPSKLPKRLPPMHSKPAVSPSSRSRKQAKPKKRRKRNIYWSTEEEEYLRKGVEKLGVGKWKQILDSYPFNPCRTTVDVKDKWRNMNKRRM